MVSFTRRDFLATCAAGIAIPATDAAAQSPVYIYASESASNLNGSPLVVGFLVAHAAEQHLTAIRGIKSLTGYKRPLAYRTTDSFKLGYARELLHYFAKSDLRFVARVVESPRAADFRREALRIEQFTQLFDAAKLPAGSILRMKRKPHDWGWTNRRANYGDQQHAARIDAMRAKRQIVSGEAIGIRANDGLVELSNLLTGTVHGAWARAADVRSLHPVKYAILTRLHAALALPRLQDRVEGKWELTAVRVSGGERAR